jgi:hypothetical protein
MDATNASQSSTTAKSNKLTLKSVVANNFLSSKNAGIDDKKNIDYNKNVHFVGAPGKIVVATTSTTPPLAGQSPMTTSLIKPKSPANLNNLSTTTSTFNSNIRQEKVKQNWDIILNALRSKANMSEADDPFLESNNFQARHNYLHASDKENWIFFTIIISIVIMLSILFCYLVFKFFPKYSD